MQKWSIGIDVVDITRFRKLDFKQNKAFYEKTFSDDEITYCLDYDDSSTHFAGIFAAKEAVFKALNKFVKIHIGTILIKHNQSGKPYVVIKIEEKNIKENIKSNLKILAETTIEVSITHTHDLAIAWALAVKTGETKEITDNWLRIDREIQKVINDELK
ncbi:MAG: holo-ACP synthase [Asgard group archaeon]|nr:holo-ACP synthase [Asgard group archaeon]